MSIQDIKEQMKVRGLTIKSLADMLCVDYNSLRQILSGKRTLTAQLNRHIELSLGIVKEEMVIYKVTIPDEVVERVVPNASQMPKAQLEAVIRAVLRKNVEDLAEMGATLEWTDKERAILGI